MYIKHYVKHEKSYWSLESLYQYIADILRFNIFNNSLASLIFILYIKYKRREGLMKREECFSDMVHILPKHIWSKELTELCWKNTIETFARAVTIKILQTRNTAASLPDHCRAYSEGHSWFFKRMEWGHPNAGPSSLTTLTACSLNRKLLPYEITWSTFGERLFFWSDTVTVGRWNWRAS